MLTCTISSFCFPVMYAETVKLISVSRSNVMQFSDPSCQYLVLMFTCAFVIKMN